MTEKELLELGFKKHEWNDLREFSLGCILITGITLVEICQNGEFITVKNCETIDDLKQLIRLFL